MIIQTKAGRKRRSTSRKPSGGVYNDMQLIIQPWPDGMGGYEYRYEWYPGK